MLVPSGEPTAQQPRACQTEQAAQGLRGWEPHRCHPSIHSALGDATGRAPGAEATLLGALGGLGGGTQDISQHARCFPTCVRCPHGNTAIVIIVSRNCICDFPLQSPLLTLPHSILITPQRQVRQHGPVLQMREAEGKEGLLFGTLCPVTSPQDLCLSAPASFLSMLSCLQIK